MKHFLAAIAAFTLSTSQLDTITAAASTQATNVPVPKGGTGKPAVVKGQQGSTVKGVKGSTVKGK